MQAEVVLGVVADLVALGEHPAHEVGPGADACAHDEEGRLHAERAKLVQERPSALGMGAIVEGEGEGSRVARPALEEAVGRVEQARVGVRALPRDGTVALLATGVAHHGKDRPEGDGEGENGRDAHLRRE